MRWSAVSAALAVVPTVFAQTEATCNPRFTDGCAPNPALGTLAKFNWNNSRADNDVWNATAGTVVYTDRGAEFTINHKRDSPTIASMFYFFFGRVSVIMKAAAGDGIVSSVMLWSDDMDEIDWEWIGGKTDAVQSNFFGKGDNTTYDRAAWHKVDNTLNQHNYTIVWTKDQMEWHIDGQVVRITKYDDPLAMSKGKDPVVGDRFPQTPMNLRIGIWAGGDPDLNGPGVVQWSHNNTNGGTVDYNKAPFVQTVTSVEIQDFSTGKKEYIYGDKSGSWQSIKAVDGQSQIAEYIVKPRGIVNRWNALPAGAKIGIVVAAASVAGILLILLAFCCIKKRRAGKKERAVADAEWENNLQELQRYKRAMVAEEEIHPRAGYI